MKKIILLSLAFILLAIAAIAQRGGGRFMHFSKKQRHINRIEIKKDRIRNHRINMNLRRQHLHRHARRLNLAPNKTSDNK
jgi:hypothetical protein